MRRSQSRVVVAVGAVAVVVAVGSAFASDRPTNRTLTIASAGEVRQVCATARTVDGDDEVDPGERFVTAPQWLEADEPTSAVLRPGPAGTGFHVTFVDAEGRVISDHDSGPATISARGPWSGALVTSPDDAPSGPTTITADDGC
jgi:hypothetical protein